MRDLTASNFGITIAYLLPGFVVLLGFSLYSETVAGWLRSVPANAPSVGGFLYLTLASLNAGLFTSTVRWAVVDTFHHATGLPKPNREFARLQEKLGAYQYLVTTHYHFYQYYANLLTAVAISFAAFVASGYLIRPWYWVAFGLVEVLLWAGSRNTLRQYYEQGEALLLNAAAETIRPAPDSEHEFEEEIESSVHRGKLDGNGNQPVSFGD